MGNCISPTSRRYQLLIGHLPEDLPREEVKLFSLSHLVFDIDDLPVNSVSEILGFRVFDKMVKGVPSKTKRNTETFKTTADEANGNHSVNAVVVDISEEFTLFYVLITDKPFYFSQSYSQWLTTHRFTHLCPPFCCRPVRRTIYLQPVDNFPDFITDFEIDWGNDNGCDTFFSLLQQFMEAFFDEMDVSVLPNVNILESKWKIKSRIHQKTGTRQYFVQDFFPRLRKVLPNDGFCIMGISWTDLYPTEALNFVLGEAHYIQKSGVFCFGRFEPKAYDPDTHKDITEIDENLMWRIIKVLSHETCHLFGLQHCWYFHCAMNESNSVSEAASQPLFLCPICLRKLQHVCGFRVLHRYRRLYNILQAICAAYPSDDFKKAVKWLENCLTFLTTNEK